MRATVALVATLFVQGTLTVRVRIMPALVEAALVPSISHVALHVVHADQTHLAMDSQLVVDVQTYAEVVVIS